MLLQYDFYYKRFGIRKLPQLINPPTFSNDLLQLSRSAIYHVASHDPDITMPNPDDPVFRPYIKKIVIDHVSELTSFEGNPKHLSKPIKTLFREWQLKNNRKFRWSMEPDKVAMDALTLITYNYGLLHSVYRYVQMPMTGYYQWLNLEKTVWGNIGKVANESHKQQFIIKDLPVALPTVGLLKMFAQQVSLRTTRVFTTPEALFLLDLWRWIDPDTRELSTLSILKPEQLKYVNIVLRYKDRFTVLNLQKLDEWNLGSNSGDDLPANAPRLKPMQLQRFILKMMLSIQTSVVMPEPPSDDPTPGGDDNSDEDLDDTESSEEPTNDVLPTPPDPIDLGLISNAQHQQDIIPISEPVKPPSTIEYIDDKDLIQQSVDIDIEELTHRVDEELQVLDKISPMRHQVKDEEVLEDLTEQDFMATDEEIQTIQNSITIKRDPIIKLKETLDLQAEQGVITAQNYRTLTKQIEQAQNLKSPKDPTKTLSEYVKIPKETITISEEETKLPDLKTVQDSSMLRSSLLSFDKKYCKEVLPKDIQANIHHLANVGIIVKDYQIEEESSAMGQYEHHTVKIRPIDGVESSLHFRIPVVDSEGEMLAGGSKYRMRKNRSDLPIRKISPSTVALSSYYGKLFVNRCERKQFDDMDWLGNKIMSIGLAGGDETIKKVTPARVYDNHFKAPRIYSSIAMRFKQLVLKDVTLMFDHKDRSDIIPGLDISKLEKDGLVVSGKTKANEPIVVGMDDVFMVYRQGTYIPIGNIYDLTGIEQTDAPISFSELKVFAKSIPLGVVMGYYIGLRNLIKLLKCRIKVIDRKTRVQLDPHEWKLTFGDKQFIFDRRDTKATLLLSGFLFYKDTIKHHDVTLFDDKDIYLLLLDQRGLSVRYLRELDTLNDLFIDPITESLLEELNEPVTFQGILMRANEMLMMNYHPDTNDMTQMRIKGYERVAGLMYREMINSVREYKSRNIRGKSQMTINPYAVWRAVTQDQTVKLSEDINPINDAKEVEAVTYAGADGRSKDAMSKEAREYHPSDMGTISEATVDSGDVGINTYLSGNPKFTSIRGITNGYNQEADGAGSLLSTSALLAPFSTNDDQFGLLKQ